VRGSVPNYITVYVNVSSVELSRWDNPKSYAVEPINSRLTAVAQVLSRKKGYKMAIIALWIANKSTGGSS